MKVLFSLILLLAFFNGPAQSERFNKKLMDEQNKWYKGSLALADGGTLNGLVQYNDKIGSLSLKTDEGTESYSANTVTKFEFFDSNLNAIRSFISLEYPIARLQDSPIPLFSLHSKQAGKEKLAPTFFEILRETNQFALLSKIKPIEFKQKVRVARDKNGFELGPKTEIEKIKQNEIIFFLTPSGDIIPYMEIVNKEVDTRRYYGEPNEEKQHEVGKPKSRQSAKVKNVDSNVLAKVTGEHYSKLVALAKANDLNVEDKDDLIRIIDYYVTLQK